MTYEPNYNADNTIRGYVQKDPSGAVIGFQSTTPNEPSAVQRYPSTGAGSLDPSAITGPADPQYAVGGKYNPAPTGITRYTAPTAPGGMFAPGGAYDTAPVDEVAIREKARKEVQTQIDAVNELARTELVAALGRGEQRKGQTRAIGASSGLLGSPTGDAQAKGTEAINVQEEQTIRAAQQAKIAEILAGVTSRGDTLVEKAKTAATLGADKYAAFIKDQATQSKTDMTALATAGADLTSEQRTKLMTQTGYDPETFDALYKGLKIANSNQYINKDKPEIVGNKAVFFKKNADGSISSDTVDLPAAPGKAIESVSTSKENGVIVFYKDGTYKQVGAGHPTADTGGAPAGYKGEFGATISLAAQAGSTNAQREQIATNLKEFIANGDYKSAYTQILGSTSAKLTGANASNFQQQIQSNGALKDMAEVLKEFEAAGGDTNIFKGGLDKVQTKIGALITDPKYAAIATRLDSAFQQYRQNMTGAAFGVAESAEYASVIPAKGNTFALNMAKIEGARQYLDSVIENNVRLATGQGGVEIKKYAEGAKPAVQTGGTGSAKEFDDAESAPVGSTVTINGKTYKKTGTDSYEPQ